MIKKIVFIGAGNLATHLALALKKSSFEICQVYSRTQVSAETLAKQVGAVSCCDYAKVNREADLYIFALSDKALPSALETLQLKDKFLVHTAGSLPMSVFDAYTSNYGVLYPLQTFSKARQVDFSKIPICIEANKPEIESDLMEIGKKISNSVQLLSSKQRKQLHMAAVFTCNFTNHMYHIGQQLLTDEGLEFDLLKPLIMETAEKVQELSAKEAQTGPAVRFDEEIIKAHEENLKMYPDFQKLYRFVSESIHGMQKNKE
ncbi:Rossmann-like and DUF2520 domain-containing protein [Ancylomarina sp. 16SWW S1-10-2]|uniref:Rossmann-like and DUF2520 domain-containing protein n=1 Tax=Ancylomarina sp. 16SWW S1-10-2 TaxID=2499681 RepID=UPI0012AD90C3|nr:Rossmann-like and DUF2520 domain-containing protein [Ancylomarina sp. 16SWW S1-10-2]MRT94004.1 DUF2520 domain-containing protein [Ancylomarina sp. 16SWW S1-10-2]